MTSPHTTVLPGGTWLHGLPLQSCTHFLALHVKLHTPERHCCPQYSTSLAHTIWQLWHFWKQFLAEHVRVLHRWPGQAWVQLEGLKFPCVVIPHLHNTSPHFCIVFDWMTVCFLIEDAATSTTKKNLMKRSFKQTILLPIKRAKKKRPLEAWNQRHIPWLRWYAWVKIRPKAWPQSNPRWMVLLAGKASPLPPSLQSPQSPKLK